MGLQSRWWRDIQKLENESSEFNTTWFNDMVGKEVGSGSCSYFSYDPWLEGGPLFKRFPRLFSLSLDKKGLIKDVIEGSIGGVLRRGRWRELFEWENGQFRDMLQMIRGAGLKWEGVDRWVWKKDTTGSYTVRTAYKWLRNSEFSNSDIFLNKLWSCDALLKAKAFVWKLVQNRIPTAKNLAKKGVMVQNGLCLGCKKEEETVDHLFFKCELF